jgi:two-component system, sensor histidine kinase and response regulator
MNNLTLIDQPQQPVHLFGSRKGATFSNLKSSLDNIARLATQLCQMPIALISLIEDDGWWFKSKVGLSLTEETWDWSFCTKAIQQKDIFIIEDTLNDPNYRNNPIVAYDPHVRCYVGIPLITPEGVRIGTLSVIDLVPRRIELNIQESLRMLSNQIVELITLQSEVINLDRTNLGLQKEIDERKRKDEEQRERDEHFRSLIEEVKGYAVYMIDTNGRIVSWNIGAERLTGYKTEEVIGKHFSIFHTSEDVNSDNPARELIIAANEGRFEDESWRIRKNGTRYWASIVVTALKDEEGNLYGYSRLIHDITEQKIIEAKLRMGESQYRMLMEQASDGIFILDKTAKFFISINSKACEMLGFTQEEFRRKPAHSVFNATDTNLHLDELKEGEAIIREQSLPHKNGAYIIAEISATRLEDGRIQAIIRDITKRKRSEDALAASEKKYRHLIENSKALICTHALDGKILTVNQAVTEALGYTADEMIGKSIKDFLHPSVKHFFDQYLADVKTQPVTRGLMRMLTKDGKELIWSYQNSMLEEDGEIQYIFGYSQDVTQRIYAEEALQRSQSLYSSLVEGLPLNLYIKNQEGRFTFVNKRFYETTGKSPIDVINKTDADVYPIELAIEFTNIDRKVIETGQTYEGIISYENASGNKRYFHLIETPVRNFNGEMTGTQGMFWDITERQQAEEAKANFVAILEETTDLVCTTDRTGKVTYMNRAGRKMIGITDNQILDLQLTDYYPEWAQDIILKEALPTAISNKVWTGVTAFINRDGNEIPISQVILAHRNKRGDVEYFSTVARDVSAQKEIEAKLERSRDAALASAELKSQFVANMSHEIRTPMNGILGMTSLLLTTELDPIQKEFAEAVDKSAQSLLTVINDVLDFSKIEAGKLSLENTEFNLYDAVENSFDMLVRQAQSKGVELGCIISDSVPTTVCGDSGRLGQVIINLVGNAVKFTDQGKIVIYVTKEKETSTHITIRFAVTDTGIGLPEEAQYHIFNAFTQVDGSMTRKYGGTGLGLAICKQLVEMMGGQIGVQSKLGEGSTFWFTARFENQTTQSRQLPLNTSILDKVSLLVVSANEITQHLLAEQALEWGLPIEYAVSSKETISLLQSSDKNYIVILDMPDSDALVISRSIKANPNLANYHMILAIPMYQRINIDKMKQAGVSAYLTKPIKPSRLYKCLTDTLDNSQEIMYETESLIVNPHQETTSLSEVEKDDKPYRILVVEDNEINRMVILGLLQKHGYTADTANNGLEALLKLESQAYDLVFMDCQMPVMDGYEATKEIRQKGESHIPIIALTAHTMIGDKDKCIEAGMDDYLAKPIKESELKQLLDQWLLHQNTSPSLDALQKTSDSVEDILDLNILTELYGLKTPQNTELLGDLVHSFINDIPEKIVAIRTSFLATDYEEIEHLAHQLKSCSGSIGVKKVMNICSRLEEKIRGNDKTENEIEELINGLEGEFKQSCVALEDQYNNLKTQPID